MIVPHSYGHFQFIVSSAGYFFPPATFFNDVVVSPRVLLSLRIERGSNTCTPVNVCAYTQTWCRQCSHVFSLPPLSRPPTKESSCTHMSLLEQISSALVNFVSVNPVSFHTIRFPTVRASVCVYVRAPPRGVTSNGSLFFILSRPGLFTLSTVITRIPRSKPSLLFEFPILFLDSLFRLADFSLGIELRPGFPEY